MWSCHLFDTVTGLLGEPIDIPAFTWSMDVNICTLNTTREKRFADGSLTGLTLPWSAVPGASMDAKLRALASYRRSLLVSWREQDGTELPVIAGAIGERKDSRADTTFDILSPYEFLDRRVLVREGAFGAVRTTAENDQQQVVDVHATQDTIHYQGLSQRAIACDVIRRCTEGKPGGKLPIDLPYLGETAVHTGSDGSPNQNYWRDYHGFNVANNSCKAILLDLAKTSYGPDMTFRPYMSDETHVRYRFVAGSDWEPYLHQDGIVPTLTCYRDGGTLQDASMDHEGPTMRIFGTGNGSDESMQCHLAQDLSLVQQRDPWPLMELARADTNLTARSVGPVYDGMLAQKARPIMQLSGTMTPGVMGAPRMGTIWPGEVVDVDMHDFPGVPDGTYPMRIMQMSGDASKQVKLLFDIYEDTLW